ncbi:DUF4132 domain-containing protein [Sphaerimonospora thailandensis]|uniref:DUF4132 domain-containing protein n=1 Tax=Sphaerimonospora thailandensis TaxID=795644 RepID=A0A8J3RAR3_9ACTN|nr:DUF4132 domain-containing protein [Sphaerimonospora thailandensis]GIH71100.1 hypothetical protein Mth01_33530 [Sphaerimonospora thailandensis]
MSVPDSLISPLAQRLRDLITGSANDPSYWPDASQLSVGLVGLGGGPIRVGDGSPLSAQYAIDEQARRRLVAPARELVGFLLRGERLYESFSVLLVAAGLAGMDTEVRARLAEQYGPIAVAEMDVLLGWDVELRALFAEAVRHRPDYVAPLPSGVPEWLNGLPGYLDFARAALETAEARVAAIHAGEIPYKAEKAFEAGEKATLGRAVRLALLRDEPWLPELLDSLVRGIAVAPTQAKTLPSQALLFEIARAAEEYPTPEVISALRAARRAVRHAAVPKQLDRMFKRIEPALADRLEVAFRLPDGRVRQAVGEHTAVISTDGGVELSWWHGDRKLKGVPAAVRREHPEEVKRLRELAKQAQQRQTTLSRALEAGYTSETAPPYRQLEGHPVTDRLIWEFEVSPGVWRAELGLTLPDVPVRLWHPARASVEEVRAWREVVQDKELRQPFKQAFREVYLLTPAEEETGDHSNRFVDHVVDYRRLRALFKDRGWQSNFMGPWDGGYDNGDARRVLAGGQWRATLDHHLYDYEDGYAETGQVHFDRLTEGSWHRATLTEVPALVFSEAMRDIDLFVAVSSITADPRWADQGPDRLRDYWQTGSFAALPPSAEVRRDALSRLIGRTAIADRCTITDRFLVVRGDIRTYKIHLGSANILMEPNDAYLCIVSARDPHAGLFLPFEEDGRLALILSKAFLLANDTAITDPSITRQLQPDVG